MTKRKQKSADLTVELVVVDHGPNSPDAGEDAFVTAQCPQCGTYVRPPWGSNFVTWVLADLRRHFVAGAEHHCGRCDVLVQLPATTLPAPAAAPVRPKFHEAMTREAAVEVLAQIAARWAETTEDVMSVRVDAGMSDAVLAAFQGPDYLRDLIEVRDVWRAINALNAQGLVSFSREIKG